MGGILSGGTSRQATAQDLELYERVRRQQAQQLVPVLHHRVTLNWIIGAASLALAACTQSPTHAASPVPKETAVTQQDDEAAKRARMDYQPVTWPLRFKRHNFGIYCYDTQYCGVWYGGMEHAIRKATPPSSTYGPDYQRNWSGMVSFDNFPPPAEVTWRSKDGTEHKAEIDIGAIFKDELIRHHVPREERIAEAPNGTMDIITTPDILLEVNDRTIRVYMRPWIPLKKEVEIAGRMRSKKYDDLILVKTHTY